VNNLAGSPEQVFITKLTEDLHLSVTWDEFDEADRSLMTWRFPGALSEDEPETGEQKDGEQDSESEDEYEGKDEERKAAVDCVCMRRRLLRKFIPMRPLMSSMRGL